MTTTRTNLAVAAASGLFLALAGPPFDVYPALWLGMSGLAWVLAEHAPWPAFASPMRVGLTGARRGLAFGVAANLLALRFIPGVIARFTPLPWVAGAVALLLLAAFESTRWAVAAIACETLARARVPRPVAFAAGVYGGTFVPTMIPWTVAGGVSPWPAIVQLADVMGERGVVFLMALVAGLAASAVRLARDPSRRRRAAAWGAASLGVVAAQAGFGWMRMRQIDAARSAAPVARVALVQPGIGASTRWDEERAPDIVRQLASLTASAEAHGAELVVWPEAAYPYRLVHGAQHEPTGVPAIVSAGLRGPVLTGLLTTAPGGAAYNSAIVATRRGLSPSYDKRHLLWFGETVPLADRLPWVRQVFARGLGLTPGEGGALLEAGPVRAAPLICYEDTLPEAGREAAAWSPNLLVNITNDAWFGGAESELHMRISALRAVELRRDFVRAVNIGVSSWFDASGRLRARGSPEFAGVLETRPALMDAPPTVFARFGDAPWALLGLVLANVAVWREARRAGREGPGEGEGEGEDDKT